LSSGSFVAVDLHIFAEALKSSALLQSDDSAAETIALHLVKKGKKQWPQKKRHTDKAQ